MKYSITTIIIILCNACGIDHIHQRQAKQTDNDKGGFALDVGFPELPPPPAGDESECSTDDIPAVDNKFLSQYFVGTQPIWISSGTFAFSKTESFGSVAWMNFHLVNVSKEAVGQNNGEESFIHFRCVSNTWTPEYVRIKHESNTANGSFSYSIDCLIRLDGAITKVLEIPHCNSSTYAVVGQKMTTNTYSYTRTQNRASVDISETAEETRVNTTTHLPSLQVTQSELRLKYLEVNGNFIGIDRESRTSNRFYEPQSKYIFAAYSNYTSHNPLNPAIGKAISTTFVDKDYLGYFLDDQIFQLESEFDQTFRMKASENDGKVSKSVQYNVGQIAGITIDPAPNLLECTTLTTRQYFGKMYFKPNKEQNLSVAVTRVCDKSLADHDVLNQLLQVYDSSIAMAPADFKPYIPEFAVAPRY